MSRKSIMGLVAFVFFGASLATFAQMPTNSPASRTASAAMPSEPTRLPSGFQARPLADAESTAKLGRPTALPSLTAPGNDVGGTVANPAESQVTPPAFLPVPQERVSGSVRIQEFSQVAADYAQINAEGEVAEESVGVPSIAPGSRRRVSVGPTPVEATASSASDEAPLETPSILKKPEGTPVAPLSIAPAKPLADTVAPQEETSSPSAGYGEDEDRMSSRRNPRAPGYTPSNDTTSGAPTSIRDMSYRSVSPHLRLETRGPQALNLGKESRYYVDLFNEGETNAPEVQVRVILPASVKVQRLGEGATIHPDPAGQRVMWVVSGVEARGRTTLELGLVATEAKSFDLAVDWAFRPNGFKAVLAVRQPQLQVAVSGPGEMGFGEEKSFRFTVANVGTGDAEGVLLQASATGNRDQKFEIGLLPAGSQKEFSVTFIANQPGELDVKAFSVGDGDLTAESSSKVLIRRAELVAAMTSPELKYAGSTAIFALAIGNAGNTPANDVQLSMTLPTGAKYVGGIDGAQQVGNSVKWRAGQIAAGTERLFEATLELHNAGENKVEVQARGTGSGVAVATQASTMVEALADLKLVVDDQPGPFPAGTEVTYDLHVRNRGSNSAKNLRVIMHFSEGIEPISVEGVEARLVPGQVLCEPIAQLNAGEEVSLKIKAKGDKEGNHLYRVEVICEEPETKLVSEGTTRFIPDNSSTRLSTRPSLFSGNR